MPEGPFSQIRAHLHSLYMLSYQYAKFNENPCVGTDYYKNTNNVAGAQWLSGRVLDSRPKGRGFEPHRRHCVVSLSKNINPSLVLVLPRKTRPFITERLLMGRKESNQTNKQKPTMWLCIMRRLRSA